MVLSQAEEEGYSVFCVRKSTQGRKGEDNNVEGVGWEDGGAGVLPESEADRLALVLGEPVSRTGASGPESATNIAGGCE
jgi:ataxin-3